MIQLMNQANDPAIFSDGFGGVPAQNGFVRNQPNLELELVPEICEVLLVSGKGSEDEMDFFGHR